MRTVNRRVASLAAGVLVLSAAVAGCTSRPGPSMTATPSGRASGGATDAELTTRAKALVGDLSDSELVGQVLMPSVGLGVRSIRLSIR